MSYATPTAIQFGDGSDALTSTENGELERLATTFTVKPVGMAGGTLTYDEADAAPLQSTLQSAIDEFDAFNNGTGTGARQWDVVDSAADNDPKTVELNENSGTLTIIAIGSITFKVDTVKGLLMALAI